jgi:hypothetical protein
MIGPTSPGLDRWPPWQANIPYTYPVKSRDIDAILSMQCLIVYADFDYDNGAGAEIYSVNDNPMVLDVDLSMSSLIMA